MNFRERILLQLLMAGFDAVDGSSTGTEVPWMWVLLRPPRFRGANMQAVTTIGLDIAKSVFQIHGIAPTTLRYDIHELHRF
jgi:hypothetical protein